MEARLAAAKRRERVNASTSAYGYHYRGPQMAAPQEPFGYPFHHTPVRHTTDEYMSEYDKRYGHCRSGLPVNCTFLKNSNPRAARCAVGVYHA